MQGAQAASNSGDPRVHSTPASFHPDVDGSGRTGNAAATSCVNDLSATPWNDSAEQEEAASQLTSWTRTVTQASQEDIVRTYVVFSYRNVLRQGTWRCEAAEPARTMVLDWSAKRFFFLDRFDRPKTWYAMIRSKDRQTRKHVQHRKWKAARLCLPSGYASETLDDWLERLPQLDMLQDAGSMRPATEREKEVVLARITSDEGGWAGVPWVQ